MDQKVPSLHFPIRFWLAGDEEYKLQPGTKVIYNERNGWLSLYTPGHEQIFFGVATESGMELVPSAYVGLGWKKAMTKTFAKMLAEFSGLEGEMVDGEPSVATTQVVHIVK